MLIIKMKAYWFYHLLT